MASQLSMDLKAELNRLQFGVSDVLRWQWDGEQRVTTNTVSLCRLAAEKSTHNTAS